MSTSQQFFCPTVEILSAETKPLGSIFHNRKPVQCAPDEPMSLEFEITEADFVYAAELAAVKQSGFSVTALISIPVVGAVFIASALAMTNSSGSGPYAVLLMALGSIFLVLPVLTRLRFRQTYRDTLDYQDRQGLVADRDSVRRWSSTSHVTDSWQSFDAFAEDKKSFVLFQQSHPELLPIPKRSLSSHEITGLRLLFETNLPRK